MQKHLLYLVFICLGQALQAQSFWSKVEKNQIAERTGDTRTIIPEKYETFRLDILALKNYLRNVPREIDRKTKEGLELLIPMESGRLEKFLVYESPVMEPNLAAKFPSIKSYVATHASDKSKHARFSVSSNGFYAAIETLQGEKYIDPYSEKNTDDYIVYDVKDHKSDIYKNTPMCGVNDEVRPNAQHFNPMANRSTGLVDLRVFRLAMACTGEWGRVTRRGTVEKCLADMNVMLTRMNAIYEKELAIRFIMINDNDKLIFLDPVTDPYVTGGGKVILPSNTGIINPRITGGASSYDVGHVMHICTDIGGVAQLGSACQSNKGNGVTCNNDNDLTNIVTRVMAHEVGHQFDASHTWNICQPNDPDVDNQRAPNLAYEPGSGSTIMSYAGSCGADNVASDNDDYFHVASLEQMYSKTYAGGNAFNCSDKVATTNHFPTSIVPTKFYNIPISTPFELSGDGTDEDGDVLTFCWEQYDLGEKVNLGANEVQGPLFRSFPPSTKGEIRFIPEPQKLLSGQLTEKREVLPNQTRELNFKFTIRDNHAGGSGVIWDKYKVNVTSTAGPFKMIYPLNDEKFVINQKVNVTWDVANTDQAPVNCKIVSIYGSFSSALRNDDPNLVPLAINVPNDGSHEILIPNRTSNLFRIVIKAADNIFLTTSIKPSRISEPTVPTVYFDAPINVQICQPEIKNIDIKTIAFGGLTENISFAILSGIPSGVTATFQNLSVAPGSTNQLSVNSSGLTGSITEDLIIRAFVPGVDTLERAITINYIGGDIANILSFEPANGAVVDALPKYVWEDREDADKFRIQVSTDPSFQPLLTNAVVNDTSYVSTTILDPNTIFYWRVNGINDCGEGSFGATQAFRTKAFACNNFESLGQSITIAGSGTPKVEFPLTITNDGIVSDVNVTNIRGEHTRVGDLVAYLVSPSGKEVLLWSKKCASTQNVNVGVDDQSPQFFQCPINTGKIYRPEGKLSDFNGESIKGIWKLRVEDQVTGSGGRLIDFKLAVCSSVSLKDPYIVKNEVLKIYPTEIRPISSTLLQVEDDDNLVGDLTYHLVTEPAKGQLLFNGQPINVGATFSQLDINNGKLDYKSNSSSNSFDVFQFTVTDGTGGWIGITNFSIDINSNNPSSVSDEALGAGVSIYPNPANETIYIVRSGEVSTFDRFEISDLSGRMVTKGRLTSSVQQINLDNLMKGAYVIKLTNGSQSIAKKMIKI